MIQKRAGCILLTAVVLTVFLALPLASYAAEPAWYRFVYDENDTTVVTGLYFPGDVAPTWVEVPEGTIGIAEDAFNGLENIAHYRLPSSLEWIGEAAFANNPKVETISIPASVERLDGFLFENDEGLKSVYFLGTPKEMSTVMLGNCRGLNAIYYNGTMEQWASMNIMMPDLANDYGNEVWVQCRNGVFWVPANETAGFDRQTTLAIAAEPANGEQNLDLSLGSIDLGSAQNAPLTLIKGIKAAAREGSEVSIATLLANLRTNNKIAVLCKNDAEDHAHEGVATGDMVVVYTGDDPTSGHEAAVVVSGDVLGTGIMSVSQIVRATSAYLGTEPLDGAYLAAGCINGGENITLSDIVAMANMLKSDQ